MTLTHLVLTVDLPGSLSREEVLDRRDELVDALKAKGLKVSFTVCGTDVFLVDEGVPTVSDTLAQLSQDPDQAAHNDAIARDEEEELAAEARERGYFPGMDSPKLREH